MAWHPNSTFFRVAGFTLVIAAGFAISIAVVSAEPQLAHEEAEARYIKAFQDSAEDPKPIVYPELAEMAKSLFDPKAVALDFSSTTTSQDGASNTSKGTIWYSEGQLFVEYIYVPEGEKPWVYATVDGKFLRWKHGESKAMSLERYPGDTVDFVWYLADPAVFKISLYSDYLRYPDAFEVHDTPPWRRLVLKEPYYGLSEITVRKSPLWLREIVAKHSDQEPTEYRMAVEPPKIVDEIPERLKSAARNLDLEEADYTIEIDMDYL